MQFDPEAWNRSLDRYLEFQPQRMFLTHYGMVEDVQRLAGDLRTGIARCAGVARDLAGAGDRHARLKQALLEMTLADLRRHECPLPEAAQRELLAMDMELNSQGLEVWLDSVRA